MVTAENLQAVARLMNGGDHDDTHMAMAARLVRPKNYC